MGFVDVESVSKTDQTVYKMPVKVEISESAVAKLKTYKEGDYGRLMTTWPNDKILTILSCLDCEDDKDHDYDLHCPGGVTLWGSFLITGDHSSCVIITNRTSLAISLNTITGEILATYVGETRQIQSNLKVVTRTAAELAETFYIARCQFTMPVSCELTHDAIEDTIHDIIKRLRQPRFVELNGFIYDKPLETVNKKKEYPSWKDMEIVEVTLIESLSDPFDEHKALLIDYKRKPVSACWFDLCIDVIAMVRRTETAQTLAKYIANSILSNLVLQKICILNQLYKKEAISRPEIFHFLADHFLTVAYPKNKLDRDLENTRAKLHKRFSLPSDRPFLMRGNAFTFSDEPPAGTELINVHESVGPSNVPGGEPVLVQGRYAYHHYRQQGMDDDGWGCAYRSLQTLFSWFKLQGYTNRSVPTLKEIQQCLVNIGDKPSSFIGSSQWIGSIEVGFCLDTMLGVASRVLSVSSGDEMSMKGGELSHHFKTQGTPVMIGGGNLAHTILGVDYNKKTGDIKFLILDPHYTGADDLNTIIAKGWCGWKGINFWKKGSFYHACMPIRPRCI